MLEAAELPEEEGGALVVGHDLRLEVCLHRRGVEMKFVDFVFRLEFVVTLPLLPNRSHPARAQSRSRSHVCKIQGYMKYYLYYMK